MPVPADERQSGGDRRSEGEGDDPDERRPRAVHGAILPRRYRPRCATISLVADNIFDDARLAQVYDHLDPDRRDLDVYLDIGARTGRSVGAGRRLRHGHVRLHARATGHTRHCGRAGGALRSTSRARKPGANKVRWLLGDATMLPVAQRRRGVHDGQRSAGVPHRRRVGGDVARGSCDALRPVARWCSRRAIRARRGWEEWTPELTFTAVDVPEVGAVESWEEVVCSGRSAGHLQVDDCVQARGLRA